MNAEYFRGYKKLVNPLEAPDFIHEGDQIVGFGTRALRVETIPVWLCRMVIRDRHYSKRVVQNARLHLGIFTGRDLVGVMQLGYALNPSSAGKIVRGTANDEYLELNRLWVHDLCPKNTESRVLRFTFTLIRKIQPKVRWVQSYANERCGRFGVVYQAANFLYLGSHLSLFYKLDGEWFHKLIFTNSKNDHSPRALRLRANIHRG